MNVFMSVLIPLACMLIVAFTLGAKFVKASLYEDKVACEQRLERDVFCVQRWISEKELTKKGE